MRRTSVRRCGWLIAILAVASVGTSSVHGQLGHRIVHDWTIGSLDRGAGTSGYAPDFRRIGLTEYEGDVDGTYVSWGLGGVMTEWSATTIAAAAGGALTILLIAGGLTVATNSRRSLPAKASDP